MTPAQFKNYIDVLRTFYPNAPQFDGAQLSAWYGFFSDLNAELLFSTLDEIPRVFPRFPSIAEILSIVQPKPDHDAEARLIADRIWAGIERFGSVRSREEELKKYIGPIGWKAVEAQGGWRVICEIATYDNASSLRAQWRESAKALLQTAERQARSDRLGLGSQDRGALPPMIDVDAILTGIQTRKVT